VNSDALSGAEKIRGCVTMEIAWTLRVWPERRIRRSGDGGIQAVYFALTWIMLLESASLIFLHMQVIYRATAE